MVMMKNMVVLADFKIFINFVGKCVYADRLRYCLCTKLDDLIVFRSTQQYLAICGLCSAGHKEP